MRQNFRLRRASWGTRLNRLWARFMGARALRGSPMRGFLLQDYKDRLRGTRLLRFFAVEQSERPARFAVSRSESWERVCGKG